MSGRSPLLLALLAAAGCGGGPAAGGPPTTAAGPLPDVARIVCDGETNRLLTPAVRPQRDGVHVVVENRGAADLSFSHRIGGRNADRGRSEHVLAYGPGVERMGCMTDADWNRDPPDMSDHVEVRIEDPAGLWVDDAISHACRRFSSTHGDYVEGARGVTGDLISHAREALAPLRASDTVERAGYPHDATRRFRAVRDGEVIGLVEFWPDGHGGWLHDETTRCTD